MELYVSVHFVVSRAQPRALAIHINDVVTAMNKMHNNSNGSRCYSGRDEIFLPVFAIIPRNHRRHPPAHPPPPSQLCAGGPSLRGASF